MNKSKCPNCSDHTISYWQKQTLGPVRSIKCSKCNAKISVSWVSSMLVIIIGQFISIIGIVIALGLIPTPSSINMIVTAVTIGYIVGSLPMLYAYGKFVPLVVKNA